MTDEQCSNMIVQLIDFFTDRDAADHHINTACAMMMAKIAIIRLGHEKGRQACHEIIDTAFDICRNDIPISNTEDI